MTPSPPKSVPKPLMTKSKSRVVETLIAEQVIASDTIEKGLFDVFEEIARLKFVSMPSKELIGQGIERAHLFTRELGFPVDLAGHEVRRLGSELVDSYDGELRSARALLHLYQFPSAQRKKLCAFWDEPADHSLADLSHNFKLLLDNEPLAILSRKYQSVELMAYLPSPSECASLLPILKNIVLRSPGSLFVKLLDNNVAEFVDCFVDFFFALLLQRPKEVLAVFADIELFYALILIKLLGWVAQVSSNLLRSVLVLHTFVVNHKDLSKTFFKLQELKLSRSADIPGNIRRLRTQVLDPHYPGIMKAFVKASRFWTDDRTAYLVAIEHFLSEVCTRRENRLIYVNPRGRLPEEFISLEEHSVRMLKAVDGIMGIDSQLFDVNVVSRYQGAFDDLDFFFLGATPLQRTLLAQVAIPLMLLLGPAKEKLVEYALTRGYDTSARDKICQKHTEFVRLIFKLLRKSKGISLSESQWSDREEAERGLGFMTQISEFLASVRGSVINPFSLFFATAGKNLISGRINPGVEEFEFSLSGLAPSANPFLEALIILELHNVPGILFQLFEMRTRKVHRSQKTVLFRKVIIAVEKVLRSQTPPRCLSEGPLAEGPSSKRGSTDYLSQKMSADLDAPLLVPRRHQTLFDSPVTEALLVLAKLHKTQVSKERTTFSAGIPLKKKGLLQEGQLWTNSPFEEQEVAEKQVEEKQFQFILGPKDDFGRRIRSQLRKSEAVYLLVAAAVWIALLILISELGEEVFLRLLSSQNDDQISVWKVLLLPALFLILLIRGNWLIRSAHK